MKTEQITIDFKIGIHSRPAALLVKKVRSYPDSKITFGHNGKNSRGDSLIGLLQLGITEGAQMSVNVDGGDEETVLADIVAFIKNDVAREG
ncbi:MAG: HPr family phosphocarrier protein [Firmicutes bacterium]|nr:HPr family phosphocarrier protein [Bacillota bacterium]